MRLSSESGRRGGLQAQVVATLATVVLVALSVVGLGLVAMSLRGVEEQAADRLWRGARQLERLSALGPGRLADVSALLRTLPRESLALDWWLVDENGQLLGRSRPGLGPVPPAVLAVGLREEPLLLGGGLPPSDLLLLHPVGSRTGESGLLVGRVPRGDLVRRVLPLLSVVAWGLTFTGVIFVVAGSWLLRSRLIQPLRTLAAAARRIASGDLAARVDLRGDDELSDLGEHFNRMSASLERERDALLEAQHRLLQSERLGVAGRLASGVAHEIGNPVTAILGYVELSLRDPGLGARAREAQNRIQDEALRVRGLIRELLDVGRSSRARYERVEARVLLERVAGRMRDQPLLRKIRLEVDADPRLALRTDPTRVEQILVNLIENAAHALVHDSPPKNDPDDHARAIHRPATRAAGEPAIVLCARRTLGGTHPARRRDDARPSGGMKDGSGGEPFAGTVRLQVIDNGPGIEPEILPHVFEPFFTRKDPGEGTGLGLWNGHRVAELLGGRIEVASRPGLTTFSLLLPAADG